MAVVHLSLLSLFKSNPTMRSRSPKMRVSVASTTVTSGGYNEPTQMLKIEFNTGSVYQCYNISAFLYEQLMQALSKAQFLHTNIRKPYPYSRVG